MARFVIWGTNRRVGAIGLHEDFRVEVEAPDAAAAGEKVRTDRYAAGYEHVHISSVRIVES